MIELIPLDTRGILTAQDGEQFIAVNPDFLEISYAILQYDPTAQACIRTLWSQLFGSGLGVRKHGFKKAKTGPHFQSLLDGVWCKTQKELLKDWTATGFCIAGFRPGRDPNHPTPYRLDPLEHSITLIVNHKTHQRSVHIVPHRHSAGLAGLFDVSAASSSKKRGSANSASSINMLRPLDDVFFFEIEPVTHQGVIQSPLMGVRQVQALIGTLISCAVRAETRRSQPPLITEHAENSVEKERLNNSINDPFDHSRAQVDNMYRLNMNEMEMSANQERRQRYEWEQADLALREDGKDPYSQTSRYPADASAQSFYHVRVNIEKNRRLVQGPVPESPQALVEMLQISEADISKVLGVPSACFGSARTQTADALTARAILWTNLLERRTISLKIIEILLQAAYGEWNDQESMKFYYSNEKSVEENFQAHQFEPYLPAMIDPEMLMALHAEGAMAHLQRVKQWSRITGLPLDEFASEQMDPALDRPAAEVYEEQRQDAQEAKTQGKNDLPEATHSVTTTKTVKKAPGQGTTTTTKINQTEKAADTRFKNNKDVGNLTHRPRATTPGLQRNLKRSRDPK